MRASATRCTSLGQSYLGAGNYGEALAVLDRVILEHPDCDCFGQAWLDKGAAQAGLGDSAGARRTYRTFARDYPDHPLAPEALWQSGRRALDDGNQIEAAVDFLALADAFPASERAPQALYALGMGAFNAELYPQAVEALDRAAARLSRLSLGRGGLLAGTQPGRGRAGRRRAGDVAGAGRTVRRTSTTASWPTTRWPASP